MIDMENKWFGTSWGAPICDLATHVATPVGESCLHCDEPIYLGDRGFTMPAFSSEVGWTTIAVHFACHMRGIIGGLNHLRGTCMCCGGSDPPDPPEMTRREAAEAAYAYYAKENL